MLSGYNRHTKVRGSDFEFIGGNAIASWGFTNETSTDRARPGLLLLCLLLLCLLLLWGFTNETSTDRARPGLLLLCVLLLCRPFRSCQVANRVTSRAGIVLADCATYKLQQQEVITVLPAQGSCWRTRLRRASTGRTASTRGQREIQPRYSRDTAEVQPRFDSFNE